MPEPSDLEFRGYGGVRQPLNGITLDHPAFQSKVPAFLSKGRSSLLHLPGQSAQHAGNHCFGRST